MSNEHTPTPWVADGQWVFAPNSPKRFWGKNKQWSGDFIVAQLGMYTSAETQEIEDANAAYIVKCVNVHDALVRALQHLADLHESNMAEIGLAPIDSITLSNARAALAKAQGDGK